MSRRPGHDRRRSRSYSRRYHERKTEHSYIQRLAAMGRLELLDPFHASTGDRSRGDRGDSTRALELAGGPR